MSTPPVWQDKDGDLWVDTGNGHLVILDKPALELLSERTVTHSHFEAATIWGPLTPLEPTQPDDGWGPPP